MELTKHNIGIKLARENLEQVKYVFILFPDECIKYDWEQQLEQHGDSSLFHFNTNYWCNGLIKHNKKEVSIEKLLSILQQDQFKKQLDNMPVSLVVGEWYSCKGGLVNYQGTDKDGNINGYGFVNGNGKHKWFNDNNWALSNPVKATKKEIIQALEKECIKRYGEDWRNVNIKNHASNKGYKINAGIFINVIDTDSIYNKNGELFYNGVWAEKLEEPALKVGSWYKLNVNNLENPSHDFKNDHLYFKFNGIYTDDKKAKTVYNIGFSFDGDFSSEIACYEYRVNANHYKECSTSEVLQAFTKHISKEKMNTNQAKDFINKYL